jgi:hypothetical protein
MALKRRPQDRISRRDRRADWVILPSSGSRKKAPPWPLADQTPAEIAAWKHVWSLPVACWWWEQRISPMIVSQWVRLQGTSPERAVTSQLARELGLTPGSMLHLRLIVEKPEAEPEARVDPYAHLRKESES